MFSIPLYFKIYQSNLLKVKIDYDFVFIVLFYLIIQFFILKKQRKKPKFLIPSCLRSETNNFYRYEKSFEVEADLSGHSYLSPQYFNDPKPTRTKNRLRKMRAEECSICFNELGSDDNFAKTPCNHRFHLQCLQEWMQNRL